MTTKAATMEVMVKPRFLWRWLAVASAVVMGFGFLSAAVTTGWIVAGQLQRINEHETAILVLERHASQQDAIAQRNGWILEHMGAIRVEANPANPSATASSNASGVRTEALGDTSAVGRVNTSAVFNEIHTSSGPGQ